MRTVSEYLPSALAGLRNRLMPDCSETLSHAGRSATVTRVGTFSRGEDTLTDADVVEDTSVLALAADFPELTKGSAVELGGSLRLVVSLKTDPAHAMMTVGLSAAFEKCPAAYRGKRRDGDKVRSVQHPLAVLFLEVGPVDNYSEAVAPTSAIAYRVAIRHRDWPEVTDPEVSDTIEAAPGGRQFVLKVTSVARHDGWYVLQCRTKG